MMKITRTVTGFIYKFENGEEVTINSSECMWHYRDANRPKYWNSGTFVYDEAVGKVYIMTFCYKIEAAVIIAMRDLYGFVEWVEPKIRRKSRKV